jgi:hypothetical protein
MGIHFNLHTYTYHRGGAEIREESVAALLAPLEGRLDVGHGVQEEG